MSSESERPAASTGDRTRAGDGGAASQQRGQPDDERAGPQGAHGRARSASGGGEKAPVETDAERARRHEAEQIGE